MSHAMLVGQFLLMINALTTSGTFMGESHREATSGEQRVSENADYYVKLCRGCVGIELCYSLFSCQQLLCISVLCN